MNLAERSKATSIVIFESIGGTDKGSDGHRKDTLPIAASIESLGWHCEVIKFENEKADSIVQDVSSRFTGYISRINPGSLPDNEAIFMESLAKLSKAGLVGLAHPDSMVNFGSKTVLSRVNKIGLTPEDTYCYLDFDTFKANFPVSLTHGDRVLKQNRGSSGEGIWRVSVVDERFKDHPLGVPLPLNTRLKLTEARDNHVEFQQLGDFMEFCEKYLVGTNGCLVDIKFLPRILEGEIRVLMIGANPVFVVHKKPANTADAFSATLFSGAKYTYEPIENWKNLIEFFMGKLPQVLTTLGESELPLIWTADFILDTNEEDGSDKYVLGEINCSCVGFTSHLDLGIQDMIAKEAIRQIALKQ